MFTSRHAVLHLEGATVIIAALLVLSAGAQAPSAAGPAWCWGGRNDWGVLGNGQTNDSDVPVAVADGRVYTAIAAADHVCALDTAGTAWCWGRDDALIPGTGFPTYPFSTVPVQVYGAEQPFKAIRVGSSFSCALDVNDQAWCWGNGNDGNRAGMLGTDQTNYTSTPVPVAGNHTFTALSLGEYTACALDPEGLAWCWGSGTKGQLGNGNSSPDAVPGEGYNSSKPLPVAGGHTFAAIETSSWHTCALETTGKAWCWGEGVGGMLGNNQSLDTDPWATNVSSVPVPVAGDHAFVDIGLGVMHTCALDAEGLAWCWGKNDFGQLGNGNTNASSIPVPVSQGRVRFVRLTTGSNYACGLEPSGRVWCWGVPRMGMDPGSVPVPLPGGTTFGVIDIGCCKGPACGLAKNDSALLTRPTLPLEIGVWG